MKTPMTYFEMPNMMTMIADEKALRREIAAVNGSLVGAGSLRRCECPSCNHPVEPVAEFGGDQSSLKEWIISGLCLACQNEVFK